MSVNQLSLHGAKAVNIQSLPEDQVAPGDLLHQIRRNKKFSNLLLQKDHPMTSDRETSCKNYEQRFERLPEDEKLSKLCSEAGLRLVEIGQFFYALPSSREEGHQSSCREYTMPRDQEGTRIKGWIRSNVRFGPVSDIKVCNHNGRYSIEVQVQSLFQDQTVSWVRIVNGIDKFVREAMPIPEEEKASGNPLQRLQY